MAHTIREAYTENRQTKILHFSRAKSDGTENTGAGWSFTIKNGDLQIQSFFGLENLLRCVLPDFKSAWNYEDTTQTFVTGTQAFGAGAITTRTQVIRHPKIIGCGCGAKIALSGFTNTCRSCDTDYNMSGQTLAPRHFWGEETGEHFDCNCSTCRWD